MEQPIFDFDDYKPFIVALIETFPNEGRGVRRKLAEACGCQVAYVSHVLAGDKNFSLEQAEAAARFFCLREDETEFFLLLTERARAGTVELRRYLDRQLSHRRLDYQEIKKRIRIHESISPADQAMYYSSWHYQAVHSAMTIPGLGSADAIAQRIGLDSERANEIILFLLSKGLVKETKHGYQPSEKQIHLPRTSPLIGKLHANWRVRTLSSLDRNKSEDYHYSGLVTLSQQDMLVVREILTRSLAEAIEVIKPSKEEKLCLLAMDFFEI
jgi:uncharacterized protein (TIGR02147 family)